MDCPSSRFLRRGRFSEPGRLYLLTSIIEHRKPLLQDFHIARLVVAQFMQAQREGSAHSLAWVVMPDHVHWLIELQNLTLATLMRRFKSRTGCAVLKACRHQGRIWQPGFHDRALRREDDARAVARYIVANPLRAGLVKRLGDYPHWDDVWL